MTKYKLTFYDSAKTPAHLETITILADSATVAEQILFEMPEFDIITLVCVTIDSSHT